MGENPEKVDFPVILAAQLLFVFFVLREEFAFLFLEQRLYWQRFREAEGEASPQSPLAGALLLKKGKKREKKKK